jgi:acyl carrier protein
MTRVPPTATPLDALSSLLSRLCQQPFLALTPDMLLLDIPGIDSLRLLQAVALMEEQFHVEVDVVALEDLHRVHDILEAIANARPISGANQPPGP